MPVEALRNALSGRFLEFKRFQRLWGAAFDRGSSFVFSPFCCPSFGKFAAYGGLHKLLQTIYKACLTTTGHTLA